MYARIHVFKTVTLSYWSFSWEALWEKTFFFASLFPLLLFESCSTLTYIYVVQKGIEFYSIYHFSPFSFYFQRNLLYHFVKWLFPSRFYFPFPSLSPFIQVIKHLLILFSSIVALYQHNCFISLSEIKYTTK